MSILIRHRRLSVDELFSELSRYDFIGNLGDSDKNWRENWDYIAQGYTCLKPPERDVLKAVGRSLGTSDTEGQLAMLKTNAKLLEAFRAEASGEYVSKGKLYRTCGVLAGIFAAVLII